MGGDSIRVVHPLFREEGDGSIPISPLQLEISWMPLDVAVTLNSDWHSRLPAITNPQNCRAMGALFGGRYFAVALWGPPVAREYNGRGYLELRRMAIASDAPKNTGSRMLRIMRLIIYRERPDISRLISYQDTAVHTGTIYKGAGWTIGGMKKNVGTGWNTRKRSAMQTTADKVRWELSIRPESVACAGSQKSDECTSSMNSPTLDLFAVTASTNG
jgi:hypothetical protein